jgi:hypothetical protein
LDPLVVAKGRGIICICLEKSADLHGFSSTTGLENNSFIQDLQNWPPTSSQILVLICICLASADLHVCDQLGLQNHQHPGSL